MKTDDLIDALARKTRPMRGGEAIRRLALALSAGGAAALVLVAVFIGDPFLGATDPGVMTFGVKVAFTASLLLLSVVALYRAGRPSDDPRPVVAWIAAPFVLLGLLAAVAIAQTPAAARSALMFGSTWQTCLVSVGLLSIPVYLLVVWAFRRSAPTDLKLAGMLAGFTSGSVAAFVYALHCTETSPVFLLIWYGLGIGAAALAGRAAGPMLLKW